MNAKRQSPLDDPLAVERAFAAACRRLPELAAGRRLLLGCSAGGDSMALLELAASMAAARKWSLAVVHVDHRQRPESADEARFVEARAKAHGLPFYLDRLGDDLIGAGPLNEDAMRQARHAAFRHAAHAFKADALLLAHQADDRAETFLIRLLAGSGPTGLAAIRPVEQIGGLTIVRPLLEIRRAALRDWLRSHNLSWRDDPTNESLATKRGWIRHELLPSIAKYIGLDPAPRINTAAELIDREAGALAEAARLILNELWLKPEPPAVSKINLAHPLWANASAALRGQLVREWLWSLRTRPHPPGRAAVNEAMKFIEQARAGAELRTIEHIHVIHLKTGLVAFPPEVEAADRRNAAAPLLPAPTPKKRRKS
ncbi:tRNA lysidine(34) synthetase TilS [bacterium]|nr:tRNA lysidine(34) synthetase TilS [bacterium]